jgi:hypothetical protein
MKSIIEIAEPSKEYELLDSGEGYKLERFGEITLSRPSSDAAQRGQFPGAAHHNCKKRGYKG